MLYQAYEARRAMLAPLYGMASVSSRALERVPGRVGTARPIRTARAASQSLSALRLSHDRPAFGISSVVTDDGERPVREHTVSSTPFGTLVHFAKADDTNEPKVLVIPGLAGHFATLVRATVRTLLAHHDVYVADWHNARDAPVAAGRFGLDEFIEHIIDFLVAIGPGTNVIAVCQPCAAVLAAASIMAEDAHRAQPAGLVLMSGPVDARINPGPVNHFAARNSLSRLERTVITTVPWPHPGAGRRVYPGFLQAAGFMGLAPRRHISAFAGLFADLADGRDSHAARTTEFYEEYFAVLDIAAEFYLDTARVVFRDHDLAKGQMRWKGRKVDPSAISTALLTIEAEKDEMCPPGQTYAAHALCSGIPKTRRRHHLQEGVGHYGVFTGSRFELEIYPAIRSFIAENRTTDKAPQKARATSAPPSTATD